MVREKTYSASSFPVVSDLSPVSHYFFLENREGVARKRVLTPHGYWVCQLPLSRLLRQACMAALSRLSNTQQTPLVSLDLTEEKFAGLPTVCGFDPPVNAALVDCCRYSARFSNGRCFDQHCKSGNEEGLGELHI